MAVGLEGAAVDDAKVERKKWVPPKWAMNLHPGAQAAASVALYAFHMVGLGVDGGLDKARFGVIMDWIHDSVCAFALFLCV